MYLTLKLSLKCIFLRKYYVLTILFISSTLVTVKVHCDFKLNNFKYQIMIGRIMYLCNFFDIIE